MKTKVAIIGYGTMGRAIARELGKNDPSAEIFHADIGESKKPVCNSSYAILAVKPQDAPAAIKEIKQGGLKKETVLISIMAGFPIKKIKSISGHGKIVRVMPSLGLAAGEGIAGWISSGLSLSEKKGVKKFLDKITENFEVKKEDTLNKVTAVSGSGPAYFFLLAKLLEDSAKKLGFNKEEARKLTDKTFQASAALSKNVDYAELMKKVASKGGTTEAALKHLNFDKMMQKAVKAAYKRAKELGK